MQRKMKVAVFATLAAALIVGAAVAKHHKHGNQRGANIEQMFERLDGDKNGKVTLGEMRTVAIERFSSIDVDGDGVISREDRKAAHKARSVESFDKVDTDGDGSIAKEEYAAAKAERGGRRGHKRSWGMGRGGPSTLEEVQARVEKRFAKLDDDESGFFTLEDLKNLRGKRRH